MKTKIKGNKTYFFADDSKEYMNLLSNPRKRKSIMRAICESLVLIGAILLLGYILVSDWQYDKAKSELINQTSAEQSNFKSNPEIAKKDREYIEAPQILKDLNLIGCRITQTEESHIKQGNGSMYATDIACDKGHRFWVKVPKFNSEYIVENIDYDSRLGNYIILKHNNFKYIFAHTQAFSNYEGYDLNIGDIVYPGDIIGLTDISGLSTNYHLHFEKWIGENNVSLDGNIAHRSFVLRVQRGWEKLIIENKYWDKDDERQYWLNYAYKIGGKNFVGTLLAENRDMEQYLKSDKVGANGYSDWGLCQINGGYHGNKIFANGYNLKGGWSDNMKDPYKQLDLCYSLYNSGVTFYGYNNRKIAFNKRIIFK